MEETQVKKKREKRRPPPPPPSSCHIRFYEVNDIFDKPVQTPNGNDVVPAIAPLVWILQFSVFARIFDDATWTAKRTYVLGDSGGVVNSLDIA